MPDKEGGDYTEAPASLQWAGYTLKYLSKSVGEGFRPSGMDNVAVMCYERVFVSLDDLGWCVVEGLSRIIESQLRQSKGNPRDPRWVLYSYLVRGGSR